jgi:hypothetical protein
MGFEQIAAASYYQTGTEPGFSFHECPFAAEELGLLLTSGLGRFSGEFGETHLPYVIDGIGELPNLSDMTKAAVAVLENDPEVSRSWPAMAPVTSLR